MKNNSTPPAASGGQPFGETAFPPHIIPLETTPLMLAEQQANAGHECIETRVPVQSGSYPNCWPEHPSASVPSNEQRSADK